MDIITDAILFCFYFVVFLLIIKIYMNIANIIGGKIIGFLKSLVLKLLNKIEKNF